MATVTLTAIWFNLASNPSRRLVLPYATLSVQPDINVDSIVYAGGNVRKVTQPGYQTKLSIDAQAVTAAQRQLLELPPSQGGWLGETVAVRDHRGRKYHGWWDPPRIDEHRYNSECDVQLTFTSVTWSEAV